MLEIDIDFEASGALREYGYCAAKVFYQYDSHHKIGDSVRMKCSIYPPGQNTELYEGNAIIIGKQALDSFWRHTQFLLILRAEKA